MEELGRRARGRRKGLRGSGTLFFGILALGLVLAAGWSETSESLRSKGGEGCWEMNGVSGLRSRGFGCDLVAGWGRGLGIGCVMCQSH